MKYPGELRTTISPDVTISGPLNMDEWLTVQEAADYLGVVRHSVDYYIKRALLHPRPTSLGLLLHASEVRKFRKKRDALIAEQMAKAAQREADRAARTARRS